MPISIRCVAPPELAESFDHICLCGESWALAWQIPALDAWVEEHAGSLQRGEYVADVGFQWAREAGGSAMGPEMMLRMGNAGISVFLSEYPGFCDEGLSEEPIPIEDRAVRAVDLN